MSATLTCDCGRRHELYTSPEAAEVVERDLSNIYRTAAELGLGLHLTDRVRIYTDRDVEALRTHFANTTRGRPRKGAGR